MIIVVLFNPGHSMIHFFYISLNYGELLVGVKKTRKRKKKILFQKDSVICFVCFPQRPPFNC